MNRYEYAAREEKAHKLVGYARAHGIDSTQLASAAQGEWEEMAFYAGVREPSEETRKRAIQLIESLERGDHPDDSEDPLRGLGLT